MPRLVAVGVCALLLGTSAVAAQDVAALAPPPPDRSLRLLLGLGYDLGGEKLVQAALSDGTRPSIRAGGGYSLVVGAELLPALEGRLRTRLTAGLRYDAITASNAKVSHLALPLEVAEVYQAGQIRLGAGLSLSLAPRLSGSGDASGLGADFDPSLGAVALLEWFWPTATGGGFSLGARVLWQRLRIRETRQVVGASGPGLLLAWIP